ncbi:MAG: hypothetical protein LBV06_02040 [Propionibacteriaceae bacterium]|nr:hypothetical protein [Propionibacteriaceae bacterium]
MTSYVPYDPVATTSPARSPYDVDRAQQYAPSYAMEPFGVPFGLPEHPQAVLILVLGAVGLMSGVLAPFAWHLGNKARRECREGRYRLTDAVRVGRILGIIGTSLMIAAIGLVFLMGMFFFLAERFPG